MTPAQEVGGDYYDIIETPTGQRWIALGDVSGHGVDSGLIMIMAQTAIMTTVNGCESCPPSAVLDRVNGVIRQNLARLGSDHYMTMAVLRLDDDKVTVAGRHQDVILFRAGRQRIEIVETRGTWLGIADSIDSHTEDTVFNISRGDVVLLFTDGITEIANSAGEMYGQERLEKSLDRHAHLSVSEIGDRIMTDVRAFASEQPDDLTVVVVRRT
jgi:serine phosphatase RsbU (regulator of sigma subunit)